MGMLDVTDLFERSPYSTLSGNLALLSLHTVHVYAMREGKA